MFTRRTFKNAVLILALLCLSSMANAQDYLRINYRIDSLLQLGLPKSALTEVDKLDALARANKNVPQQINAVIYRMTFQSYIEENALVAIITRLKLDIDKADYPVKPVLQSILASMYYNYYQQNRWQFSNRSRLEKPSVDFRNWDLQTIIDETTNTYRASLHDAGREQNTPVDVLDGVLKGDQATRVLRPTLYDFLVHRAFDFFLSDEPALTKPRLAFSINDARFFGNSQSFANLRISTTDTASTFYQGIQYLQQATAFHLKKHNDEALADLDITRVNFLHTKTTLPDKDSLYIGALRRIANAAAANAISVDAWLAIGKYYQQKDSLKTAVIYFKKAQSVFPKSLGGKNADILLKQASQKDLSAAIENGNMPGKPLLALMNYRNVQKARYTIYRLNEDQQMQFDDQKRMYISKYRNPELANWLPKFLKDKKIAEQNVLQLPDPHDYRQHHTEFKIGALPPGNYLAFIEDAETTDTLLMSYDDFKVSGLSFAVRNNPDYTTEIRVMDRETGKPLKDVNVDINLRSTGYNSKTLKAIGKTDKDGKFQLNDSSNGNLTLGLVYKGDTLSNQAKYLYDTATDQDDDPNDRTVLFTDRQIYRPGQIIYFKALQLLVYKKKTLINAQKPITVEFKDANNKLVSSLNLKTNEFGTVSGSFIIPQSMLTGEVTIGTGDGNIRVRAEEYKRPTFQAELLPVKESYRLDDSVKVKGKVTAFSGYGLSQATVAYHITRTQNWVNYRFGYNNELTEIKTDTIKADDQGEFQIKFKAKPGEAADLKNVIYAYHITVDVTDAAGETHSVNATVNVGNNNIAIHTYLPDEILAKDTSTIFAGINNLNGQAIKGSLNIKVYALQNPAQLYKNRLWQLPDQLLMSENEFKSSFPDYTYRKEDDAATWKRLSQISDTTFNIDNVKESYFNLRALRKQTSATYQVVVSARNEKGDTISVTRYVNLLADPPKASNLSAWVVPFNNNVKPGDSADFLVGINQPCHVLMEKYEGSKLIISKWISIAGRQQHIKIPITIQDSDINVQFMMVYHNRMYASNQKIYVIKPDKKLDIRMLTYHNKLQPGQKEQWKLQVSTAGGEKQAAEMVAGLYDASLDDLAPAQNWQDILNVQNRYQRNYFNWNTYDFVIPDNSAALIYKYYRYQLTQRVYEYLDMYGYNYYGGYNSGYRQYLNNRQSRISTQQMDNDLNAQYLRNVAQVKNGVDITGKVVGANDGESIVGVAVKIKGTNILINTNSLGYFKIKVPLNQVLVFSFIGYITKEVTVTKNESLNVTLEASSQSLNEVVVVGYGTAVMKKDLTGAVASVSSVRLNGKDFASGGRAKALQNLPADVLDKIQVVDDYGDQASRITIRGAGSVGSANAPLYVIDGVISDGSNISPQDISSISVLKGPEGTALYGARAANGVIVIVTKKGIANAAGGQPIAIRKNFNETAFFYPQLRTNEKGEILIDFTIPEALTKWKFRAFAHTTDLKSGYFESEIVTQKQLSISANTPRFLREGDTITISARLANLTTTPISGKVNMQLFNAVNMQPVTGVLNAADAQQSFNISTATTKAISFRMVIPAGLDAITYRLTADGGQFTDGEENTIPVLPNRMLVTESMPMMVRSGQTKAFTFEKLVNQKSTTLKNKTLTLEYTQNPAWYAVQALPYMMEFPYECSEQIFSRYYANSLATNLVNKMPVIKQIFDRWKATNSPELLSNLEKNPELKATLLEETPWLRDAVNESEQKKRIALLFDLNKMSNELELNLDKLQKRQLPDGGFPWFGGDRSDAYITRYILGGIGQLYHLGIVDTKNLVLKGVADKAMAYMDDVLLDNATWAKKHNNYEGRSLSESEIHAYYVESYYPGKVFNADMQALLDNYLKLAQVQWRFESVYEEGMMALTLLRYKKTAEAEKIIHSLTETAQQTDEMGMYWGKNQLGYYWYQSPIETECLMIELFTEAGNHDKEVEEMKIWLLREKQTTNWKTTKATAAACYALLMKGNNWLADTGTSEIKLDGKLLSDLKPDIKAEAGTGYIKTAWADEQVKPDLGKVSIKNEGKTISWGALHWQYLENLDKITPSSTDIHLERKYFIVKQTDAGAVLTAVDATHQPKVGDLLKVVVYLKAGRDYEYVQLKDMRPAGTEPVDVLSSYKSQDGLWYYQVTKDVATNFFISNLNKGNYVFEYRLRVAQPGNFSTGISTVQCMYAPEFNAHSEGARMTVVK